MDELLQDIPSLMAELDSLRVKRGLSYQAVADACNVSKATVYRALSGATEPTATLVRQMASAVQYKPHKRELELTGYTQESYIEYLRAQLRRQSDENELHVRQLQTHYNMLRNQDRRTIRLLATALVLLVAAFIIWLIIDVTHPTIGWFQREISRRSTEPLNWLEVLLWSV